MAHPRYWTKDPRLLREGLEKLKARGLDGVEAIYQANEPDETIDHLRAAKEIGLCVTAGSDFHGANKPTIPLGMEVDDERTFLAPFFERLANRSDAKELLFRYMDISREELCGDTPVLGRMKELLSYWCQESAWRSRWRFVKIRRSTEELAMAIG